MEFVWQHIAIYCIKQAQGKMQTWYISKSTAVYHILLAIKKKRKILIFIKSFSRRTHPDDKAGFLQGQSRCTKTVLSILICTRLQFSPAFCVMKSQISGYSFFCPKKKNLMARDLTKNLRKILVQTS